MFYSHEILTSPEHGVATVWLVATLGARSISRRLNRKTIQDVDVPKACNVIMDQVAPMALRLQSNLLYGVSRVYSQQCGYTLLDVQAMHDKMRTMLRSVAARGLDPSAGKARPDQLILPYDPTFLPENNLPGLAIDFSKLTQLLEATESQQSSFLPGTPDLSQSAISSNSSLRLSFGSDDNNIPGNIGGFSSEADIGGSVQGGLTLAGLLGSSLGDDGGVLLQPDFEFDEDGNIIELGTRHQSEARTPIFADEDVEMAIPDQPRQPTQQPIPSIEQGSPAPEAENTSDRDQVTMPQRYRAPKLLPSDGQTALRSFELSKMSTDYMQNMTVASRQKQNNRIPTQAKKNAAYWVFGIGIGCVGSGVGISRAVHPLHFFSGDELREALAPNLAGRKRRAEDDEESEGRRVRAREEEDDNMGMAGLADDNNLWNEDVELGRRASPALQDDHSSQMPWNITASIQSSRHETSANIFRGFGSVSDFSSRGVSEYAGALASDEALGLPRRAHSRLTSASPLAGRGLPYDINQLNGLSIPGQDDDLEGFDLTQYLEDNAMADSHSIGDAPGPSYTSQPKLQNSLAESVMDQQSLNFLDFVAAKINTSKPDTGAQGSSADNEITFSTLLPPHKTSHNVATQGFMHILALTTKGFLSIRQDAYADQSSEEHGVRYEYGEISMRLVQM
ncbi:Rec8 like protein-domain-containing protein [Aspergillus pseudodeflectus]|uniref:Rec8 like protein-domain-containing protein n=1 Tax=Aspergillus pseudodeflectus TaxID=176178 RepID=A0ABR4JDX1_9EURO